MSQSVKMLKVKFNDLDEEMLEFYEPWPNAKSGSVLWFVAHIDMLPSEVYSHMEEGGDVEIEMVVHYKG
jgi:hypothetical protein